MLSSAIRFTVSNARGQRAATWKCWSPSGKEDVYLACRELGGALKASLHESGKWHIAYSEGFYRKQILEEHRTKRGRFIDQWECPRPIAAGVTLAFRVVTPWTSVTTPAARLASVAEVPAPPEDKAIEIDIFRIDKAKPIAGWPGKNAMGTELIGSYVLPSGDSVWVVYWQVAMPNLTSLRESGRFFRDSNLDDLKGRSLRMLAFGQEPDGSRVIYDCVGKYVQSGGEQ